MRWAIPAIVLGSLVAGSGCLASGNPCVAESHPDQLAVRVRFGESNFVLPDLENTTIRVFLRNPNGTWGMPIVSQADSRGCASFPMDGPGEVRIIARAPGVANSCDMVDVERLHYASGIEHLTMHLEEECSPAHRDPPAPDSR